VPKVGEGLSEVGDEVVLSGGLDDHIVDIGFDVLADLGFQALLDGLLVGHSNVVLSWSETFKAIW
jgi:hypothetical protein